MRLLYCDESNLEERPGDFLIYAGVIIPAENALALSRAIGRLRTQANIAPDARVKFAPPAAPLNHEEYKGFKASIIQAANEHGAKIIAYVVLHDIAENPDQARLYGINTLCWHFHCILNRTNEHGMILIDRFNDNGNRIDGHLREKMSNGIDIIHRGNVTLDNIIGYHYSAIGQSHFTSLSDIIVGSLRWAINVHCRGEAHRDSALQLLGLMSPLFWREAGEVVVRDLGFCFSPFSVRAPRYHALYTSLQGFLREGGIVSSQAIGRE